VIIEKRFITLRFKQKRHSDEVSGCDVVLFGVQAQRFLKYLMH